MGKNMSKSQLEYWKKKQARQKMKIIFGFGAR